VTLIYIRLILKIYTKREKEKKERKRGRKTKIQDSRFRIQDSNLKTQISNLPHLPHLGLKK
jgi:hypothetical protein